MMRSLTKVILFGLTAVLVFASLLQQQFGLFKFRKLTGFRIEQPFPTLNFENWINTTYQDSVETYLQQHYGFCEPLTRFYNQYVWDFYGGSLTNNSWVYASDDGWLYESGYVEEYYQGCSWQYAKDSLEMAKLLEGEARRLYQIQHILEGLDIHFFVLLEPGKEQVYPEHIPANTHYEREKVISAYDFFHERFNQLGVNHVDVAQWFLQMKDSVDYPLFPQTGTHWSNLAAMYVADSLTRYMEQLCGKKLSHFTIGEKYPKTKAPDDDLEQLLNLIRSVERAPNYYAKTQITENPNAVKPTLLTIGDSFYWNILNHTPFHKIFEATPYWYYFSSVYFDGSNKHITDIDVLEKVLSTDFVMLSYSTPQLYEMSNGFSKHFLINLCYDPDEIVEQKNKFLTSIKNNKKWMEALEARAEQQQKPIDSVVWAEMEYITRRRPEVVLPALRDDIPMKRSTHALQLTQVWRKAKTQELLEKYEPNNRKKKHTIWVLHPLCQKETITTYKLIIYGI